MSVQRGKIVAGGRLQVPASIRQILNLEDGDPVVMRVVDGELHIRPVGDPLSRIQARLRNYIPNETLLSEELIADRRVAADHE